MPSVAVIIPFYQKTPGLLGRAVRSVAAQSVVGRADILVLIVDDHSPLPADPELEGVDLPAGVRVRVEKTPRNAGAAAARNLALDRLPETVTHVAFLDSDDVWVETHLEAALGCIDRGARFYFADHRRDEWDRSKFETIGLDPARHRVLSEAEGTYLFEGRPQHDILNRAMIQTSTCVMTRDAAVSTRFREGLTIGEDSLYWAQILDRYPGLAFRPQVDVRLGSGVNVSQAAEADLGKRMRILRDRMSGKRTHIAAFPHDAAVRRGARAMLRDIRRSYVRLMMRDAAGGPRHLLDLALAAQRRDRAFLISLPIVVGAMAGRKGVALLRRLGPGNRRSRPVSGA